jgi:hypothetical protein
VDLRCARTGVSAHVVCVDAGAFRVLSPREWVLQACNARIAASPRKVVVLRAVSLQSPSVDHASRCCMRWTAVDRNGAMHSARHATVETSPAVTG